MTKIKHKSRTAVQLVFLISSVILSVIWFGELRRATNDVFIPSLILLYVGIILITALPKVLYGDVPGGAIWTYGPLTLAAISMGGLLVIHNISQGISLLPSAAMLDILNRGSGLVVIYRVIANSWLMAALHIIAAVTGVLSVYIAIKE